MAVLAGLRVSVSGNHHRDTDTVVRTCGHQLSSVRTCGHQLSSVRTCDTGSVVTGGGIPQKLGSCLFYCFMATISLWLQQAAAPAPRTLHSLDS